MSEMGDMYREMREHRQENRRKACEEMTELASAVEIDSTLRWRFIFPWGKIDFWPSNGKWMVVGDLSSRNGPRKMVTYATKRSACPQKYAYA